MRLTMMLGLVGVVCFSGFACGQADRGRETAASGGKATAVAKLEATKNNKAHGTATFTQEGDKVKVVVHVEGLTPNSQHGIHIHEGDTCGDDGMAAKGHWNPDGNPHAGPDAEKRHAGDLGNLKADADGKAHLELTIQGVSVNGAKNPVVGHSVVVHADPDDLKTQPTGNSGARIACGPIKLQEK